MPSLNGYSRSSTSESSSLMMTWRRFSRRTTLASAYLSPFAEGYGGQVERAPLSLEKLSIQDDIVTYTTKDGAAHACPP
jgi:hypothetical protein